MRKIQDFYFKKAKQESYLARSVYKLEEIDRKHDLVKKGIAVLDVGCAPGSWCQYLLKKIGNGSVTGVDLGEKVNIIDKRFRYVRGDILVLPPGRLAPAGSPEGPPADVIPAGSPTALSSDPVQAGEYAGRASGPPRFDLITSDAAPDTSGNRFVDSERSLTLVRRVFDLAREILKPGGTVVAKVFQGEDLKEVVESLRREYGKVTLFKPLSSRKESRELYIIARERRAGSD
jgi:23S rRNA (uridine2552-2'-O)-methyltransferase